MTLCVRPLKRPLAAKYRHIYTSASVICGDNAACVPRARTSSSPLSPKSGVKLLSSRISGGVLFTGAKE